MTDMQLLALAAAFFLTSAVSVITGSTSLITVPLLLQFGIEPRTALATNMFALTWMSAGGALPFLRSSALDRRRLPTLIVLTLCGSVLGALLVLLVPARAVPLIVAAAMIGVAVFSTFYHDAGVARPVEPPTRTAEYAAYVLTFLLGVYGGFFSGGYVTLLTAVYVGLLGATFIEAVATTKLVNVFSSLIATAIFMWQGLVDYRLGLILGAAMFVGALVGGRVAMRLGDRWLRRIFMTAVWALALKALLYDVRERR
jgi:uncharacterized protein